jgi:SAM-dependent methyltransferase
LGLLPFQVGHQPTPSNAPLPDALPFSVAVDEGSGLIVQKPDAQVSRSLERAYRLGSQMGTPLREEGVGSAQLDEFASFIGDAASDLGLDDLTVLEIGCGRGALLARLRDRGVDVVGVEPGRDAAQAAREQGLRVHSEPFAAERFGSERFDLIVHHCVLEHIERPRDFIVEQLGLLTARGRIVCGVPDCAPALMHGDLSMLVHEHWSYFDAQTLEHLAASAGARTLTWRRAETEGSIFSVWQRAAHAPSSVPTTPPYVAHAKRSVRAVEEYIAAALRTGSRVGIFPAARFINYLSLLQSGLATLPKLRWFDDDPALVGRFYPPIAIPIEPRDALATAPVDELLITSWTFGPTLREQLLEAPALRQTNLRMLADVLES